MAHGGQESGFGTAGLLRLLARFGVVQHLLIELMVHLTQLTCTLLNQLFQMFFVLLQLAFG
ncbi:Uncharacterised protein [Vibrio cholerae]|uniref:Uncharacterized protein n=1 Tax=Vibrio cholerae TaxID=666 RepID=A0A655VGK8_VIBCL|nr:Uncharacterised protein [Vibrio cholerae]